MYRNSHHIARNIRLNVKQIVKTVEAIISFGIDGRQWVASAIICAMIWPLFVLPTAAFGASGVNSTTAEFEPVNEQLPIWTRAWRDLSADIETRLIALRPANLINKASDDNDKKKKSVKPDEHAVKPEDAKPALTDPKPHNKAADDPDSSPVMKEGLPKPHLVAPAAAPAPMAFMSQLSPGEHDSIYNYQNNLGSPKGQVEMDSANRAAALPIKHRVGIADFSFGLPLASIPGRGIDAGVGMTYNSRTWNKSCEAYTGSNCTTDHYTYDVEQSWIAPGFSSGFGYLDTVAVTRSIHIMNTSNIYYYTEIVPAGIIDSDGTRHQFECAAGTSNNDNFVCNTYRSTDGSFISIPAGTWLANINNSQTPNTAGYAAMNFVANYPNGSKVWYAGAFGSDNIRKHYPIVIQDNNGNRVRVAYKADQSGRIDYITDTVNRKIKFYYENDGNGNPDKLVAVTIPGTGTNDEVQTVRFYYETLTLSSSGKFVGTITAPSTIRVLSRVYVPGTKTLFKYEYDTNFGMIKKITRYVGAIATSTGLTATGSITSDGLWATSTEYNYPDGSTALTDVPKYTTRTDNWQNSGGAQVTDYGSEVPSGNNGNQYISTVTTHDNGFNVVNKTISGSDGMIKETSTSQTSTGGQLQQLMSKTAYTWSSDGKRNLTNIEVTNDAGLTKVTVFGYDRYNNQTAMRECDYGVTVANCTETNALRRTVTSYETNSGWIDRNLVGLPTSSTTIVGGVNVSKTLIEYDHSGSDTTITKRTDIDINTHDTFYNPDHAAWDETICADGLGYSQSALPDGCVVIHHLAILPRVRIVEMLRR
ncbi:MAG: hypothetical protein IPI76_00300 [Chloracidobacterium sp.]|nr:hypothetical protein [Chloracidobacterium sp.]